MNSGITNEVLALIHDINSPLCALKSLIKTEQRDQQLEHEAYRKFFDLAGKLKAHFHLDINEEPNYLLDSLELSLSHKEMEDPKVVFSLNAQPSLRDLIFSFDQEDFERAVSNVLNNAVEAGATQVLVKVGCNRDEIQVKITDNGIGFFASDIQQVHKKKGFTTKTEGSGIGLSSSINFMNKVGGSLKILSTPYIGTNIIMCFPKSLFDSLDYGPFAS
ncbi:MAG: signal transduction histidine kinase [Bacteriovoracaceae bacterium]|jgi:signal transduction histidine kinase